MPFAEGLDAMPSGFCGALTVREVVFRRPGHLPITARFERDSCSVWTRRTVDSSRLPLDAPNAAGRPQWRVGPYRRRYYRDAATLGEALLLAERTDEGAGDPDGVDLAALAAEDDSIPF
jgi:hypothetical protein